MRSYKKEEIIDHLLACLEAKERVKRSLTIKELADNSDNLNVLVRTLPFDQIIEHLLSHKEGAA